MVRTPLGRLLFQSLRASTGCCRFITQQTTRPILAATGATARALPRWHVIFCMNAFASGLLRIVKAAASLKAN